MSRWNDIPEHLKDRIIIATMPKVKYIETPVVVETAGEIDMGDIANQMFHQPGKVYKTVAVRINDLPYIYRPSARSKGIYLTANAFYSQKHYIIRSNIANWCKGIITSHKEFNDTMEYLKSANIQVPIGLKFYFYKSKVFDGDNTGFFWGKFIQDLMVKHYELLKDDNIRYIKPIMYDGEEKEKGKTDKNVKLDLLLTIYYQTNEDKMD